MKTTAQAFVGAITGEELEYYGLDAICMENTVVFLALREIIGSYVVLSHMCYVAGME